MEFGHGRRRSERLKALSSGDKKHKTKQKLGKRELDLTCNDPLGSPKVTKTTKKQGNDKKGSRGVAKKEQQ